MTASSIRECLAPLDLATPVAERDRVLLFAMARADAHGVAVFEYGELSTLLGRNQHSAPCDKQHTRKAIRRAEAAGYLRPGSRSCRLVLASRERRQG